MMLSNYLFSRSLVQHADHLFLLSLIDNIVLSHAHTFDTHQSPEGSRVHTFPNRNLRRIP